MTPPLRDAMMSLVTPRPTPRTLRTYRCEDEIYDAAMAKVERLGTFRDGLAGVIRDLLEEWAANDNRPPLR